MVFTKRISTMPRKGNVKRQKSTALVAKVNKLQRQIALLKPEVKIKFIQGAQTNVTSGGAISYLSGLDQGSDEGQRVGDSVRAVRLVLNVKVTGGNSASTSLSSYAYAIVRDADSQGSTPTIGSSNQSIFESTGPGDAMVSTFTRNRFKVLAMYQHSMIELALGTKPNLINFDIPLSGVTTYRDTTSSITASGKNQYYLVMLTDDTSNTIDFAYSYQFQYTDV